MFTPPKHVTCHVSRVTCHVSCVTCPMSGVTCHMSQFFFLRTKWWSLALEGLLSTEPTPSSFLITCIRETLNLWMCVQIPKRTRREQNKKTEEKKHESCFRCQVSHVTCHVSCVIFYMSHVTCHVSCVIFYMSHVSVACHLTPVSKESHIFKKKKS